MRLRAVDERRVKTTKTSKARRDRCGSVSRVPMLVRDGGCRKEEIRV